MRRMPTSLPLLLFAFAVIASGCSKDNPTEPAQTDETYLESVVQGQDADSKDLFSTEAEAMDESAQLKALIPGLLKEGLTPITPLRYGRRITSVVRTLQRPVTRLGDSIIVAHVTVTFTGTFVIQALSGTDTVVIRKPYTETIGRNVRFLRVANTRYPRLNWRVDALSVAAGSTGTDAPVISSVEVAAPNTTFTVTDPDNYYMQVDRRWIRRLPVLNNVQITLRVTVQSTSADPELVTLHYLPGAFGLHHAQFTLASEQQQGGLYSRVYEKTWSVSGSVRKFAHLMVSATSKASLYDDTPTTFASTTWGIPYRPAE